MTGQGPTPRPEQGVPTLANLPPGGAWLQQLGLALDEISGAQVTAHLELGPQHHTPWASSTAASIPPSSKASPV